MVTEKKQQHVDMQSTHSPLEKGDNKHYLPHVAKGALINLFGAGARMIFLYWYTFLLARVLSANELGYYFMMFTIINIIGLASTVGLDLGVVRYVALYSGEGKKGLSRNTVITGLMLGVPISIVAALILIYFSPTLSNIFFEDNHIATLGLRIYAIAIPFWVVAKIFNACTQGLHKMQYQVYSRDFGEQITKIAFTLAFIGLGMSFIGVIWANLASLVVAMLLSMAFAFIMFQGETSGLFKYSSNIYSTAKALYKYSLPLAFSNILGLILFWADLLLLGYLGVSEDVGYYGTAFRIGVTFSTTVILAFSTVFQPVISDLYNKQRKIELHIIYKTLTRWMLICSIPIFLTMVMFSDTILSLFGKEFVIAAGALVLLAVGQLINAGTSFAGIIVVMSGRSHMELINFCVALVINITLCFLLIPEYGFVGAAIANISSYTTINLLRNIEVWMIMHFHAYDFSTAKPALIGAAAAGMVLILRSLGMGATTISQTILVAVLLSSYAIITIIGLGEQDKQVLNLVKNRLIRVGIK